MKSLEPSIEELTIGEYVGSKNLVHLDLTAFKSLKQVHINRFAFTTSSGFVAEDLPYLQVIEIDDYTFSGSEKAEFLVRHCNVLSSISIGKKSFVKTKKLSVRGDSGFCFSCTDNPRLESIEIGKANALNMTFNAASRCIFSSKLHFISFTCRFTPPIDSSRLQLRAQGTEGAGIFW